MPPFIPRKRPSASPPASSRPPPAKRTRIADAPNVKTKNVPDLPRKKTFSVGGSDDSDSSLSDADTDQFDDVSSIGRRPSIPVKPEEEGEDEDIDWEDAAGHDQHEVLPEYKPQSDGPIEVTLRKKDEDEGETWLDQVAANMKKAPSKRDKQVRVCSHQLHIQFLLWHNAIRNKWISDRELQQILVQQLPLPIMKEVEKWKRASGLAVSEESPAKKTGVRGRRKGKQKVGDPRRERDWGRPSQRLEKGRPDMSNGDPLISLMKVLAAFWKKKFSITAPGLRKQGHGTTRERKQIIASLKNDAYDVELHGERVRGIEGLRGLARKCEGSRDVGVQLFTALLRGLGVEARMVASLQPSGYGWTKTEQMLPKKAAQGVSLQVSTDESDAEDVKSISEITKDSRARKSRGKVPTTALDSDSEDESIVEVTPPKAKKQPQKYDRDHPFPIYWTEAISPITNKVLPVSPLVLDTPVATTPEILSTFEPRGIKAEKTKTVMAYVIAYSSDGTAKDVTTRYLKKHIWPGKTKGFRYPVEKIPVYNKHGKIKRYENYDWFKQVMSLYVRPDLLRTAVDDVEESTDLLPQKVEPKSTDQDVDTLQSLKSSADFVLERFLRREEALRPTAQPVRTFTSGKADNLKHEDVYLRADVERCLTAESWHKEGRRPNAGEAPLKLVPVRAVTITRKREAEEHERVTGEKQKQGLYSSDQTEYIIPPPIVDGIIPKNSYGNIDCFVPSMVPRGAVHVALRGTVRICKRLEIDFAEAVTGFEFGNKRAVPVCTGVVIAKEHEKAVREAWREYDEAQKLKEEKKLETVVLETWRKFVIGLRIRERVRDTYGQGGAELDELGMGKSKDVPIMLESEDEVSEMKTASNAVHDEFAGGGGFLPDSDEEGGGSDLEIGFHPNDDQETTKPGVDMRRADQGKQKATEEAQYPTPSSISPIKPAARRQRPGQSILAADDHDGDTEMSELTSALPITTDSSEDTESVVDSENDLDADEGSAKDSTDDQDATSDPTSDSDIYEPTSSKSKSKGKPVPRLRKASQSTSVSTPKAHLQRQPKPSTGTRSSTRVTKKAAPAPAPLDSDSDEEDSVMARSRSKSKVNPRLQSNANAQRGTSTPKRRTLRRDSTLVTSPYFDG